MPRDLFTDNGGAVSGRAAAIAAIVITVAAVTCLGAAKLAKPQYTALLTENGITVEMITSAETIDGFIAEQRAKLHPFDKIIAARVNEQGMFEIEVERAPTVTITDGEISKTVRAIRGEKVAELMIREGFAVDSCDAVCPDLGLCILDDCEVAVTRGFPVTVRIDGEEQRFLAAGITVGDLLVRERIPLGAYDELNVSTDDIVTENMEVNITRVRLDMREKTETVPYDTVYEDSPYLAMGEKRVAVEGKEGSVTVTICDKYVGGVLLKTELVDTKVTAPVTEVIECGTALAEPYSKREGNFTLKDGIPEKYEYVLEGKVTAYTAAEGSGTYSGRPLVIGSCGVDPDVIPFGSEVYIVSKDHTHVYGYAVASDTGDIKGSGVLADAYMGTTADNYGDALNWQAQYCDVYVLSVGDNSVSWR